MTEHKKQTAGKAAAERYSRQTAFAAIGQQGQTRISAAKVVIIGCGALGSVLAEMMVRAGVGLLRIVDRDFLELSNLQRQMLFDEDDLAANLPKAEAAARKLRRINSQATIEAVVADANHESIEHLIEGADLILDGTDNLHSRFLINDAAVKNRIPWIYGACLAASGMALVVMPAGRPCLRCVLEEPPAPGVMETCQTAGIIGPIVGMVASFQAGQALKILAGCSEAVDRRFVTFDLWNNRFRQMETDTLLKSDCLCCGQGNYEYLAGRGSLGTVSFCGRNSVQVRPKEQHPKVDLKKLADRLKETGKITLNEFLLRLALDQKEITVFPDGRAIITGTSDINEARSLYARYVGY